MQTKFRTILNQVNYFWMNERLSKYVKDIKQYNYDTTEYKNALLTMPSEQLDLGLEASESPL